MSGTATMTEREAAQLLEKLNGLFEGDDSLPKTIERFKALSKEFDELKELDLKTLCTEFDKLKAREDKLVKAIRHSKRGFYSPGIEDEAEGFSILRAHKAIKTGNWKEAQREKEVFDEARTKASHIVGDDAAGGYFVPDQVIPDVIAAIYKRSVFIRLSDEDGTTRVSILDGLVGGNVKVPKFDGGLIAYWIGEEDEYAESRTTVGDVSLNPKKLGVLIRLTDSMRRLQGFGFENLLRVDMVRAAAAKLDWTVMFGSGSDNMPLGIVNQPGIKIFRAEDGSVNTQTEAAAVADWDGGELDFDGLDNMMLGLEEDDIVIEASHAWISSPRYFKRLKQRKVDHYSGQTTNQAYLIGVPMLPDARLADIVGPFDRSTQIPSNDLPGASINGATDSVNAKYTTVFGGNLSEVVLGRWGGIEIEDDGGRGKGFTSDHTYMKLRLYADMATRQPRSLIVCPDAQARD